MQSELLLATVWLMSCDGSGAEAAGTLSQRDNVYLQGQLIISSS